MLRSEVCPLTRSVDSLAIESQLANLDFTAKTALYLNDDFFLTRVCPNSHDEHVCAEVDIGSARNSLSRTLRRLSTVQSFDSSETFSSPASLRKTPTTLPMASGRGSGIAHGYLVHLASFLAQVNDSGGLHTFRADERFGARARPYLLHIAKVISVPLLKEMQQVFISELTTVRACGLCSSPSRAWSLTRLRGIDCLVPFSRRSAHRSADALLGNALRRRET